MWPTLDQLIMKNSPDSKVPSILQVFAIHFVLDSVDVKRHFLALLVNELSLLSRSIDGHFFKRTIHGHWVVN